MGAPGRTARRLKAGLFAFLFVALAAALAPQDALAQDKPSGLTATPGAGSVVLAWNAQRNQQITEWAYHHKLSSASNWPVSSIVFDGTGDTTSVTISSLTNGMSYDFRIRAQRNAGAVSPWSDVVTATPTATPPVTITLTATPGNARIDLSWNYSGSTTHASKWQVEYFTGSTGDQWRDIPGGVAARSVALPLAGRPALVNDETYNIRVRLVTSRGDTLAQTVVGNTGWVTATPVAATTTPVPAAPTSLSAEAGNTQVVLTWTKPAGSITGYKLRYAKTPSKASATWAAMTGSGAATVRHTVTSLDNDAEYSFMIRAVNASGDGAATDWVTATPQIVCPTVVSPTNLSLAARSDGFAVTWTAPTDANRDGWTLSYKKTGGTSTSVTISDAAATSRTLTGLDAGTEYEVSLVATHAGIPGANCPPGVTVKATGTTLAGPAVPAATLALGSDAGNQKVTLRWERVRNSNPAITKWQYQQKAGSAPYGAWTDIPNSAEGGPNSIRYVVTGLTNNTVYKFKVRAVNSSGNGAASTETTATPTGAKTITLTTDQTNNRITEGDTERKNIVLTATLSEDAPDEFLVSFSYVGGVGTLVGNDNGGSDSCTNPLPATADICFPGSSSAGSVPIESGQRTGTRTVGILPDTRDEGDESFSMRVSTNTLGWSGDSILITIVDNDGTVAAPARPTGLSAEAGNGQVELTWTDPDDDSITGQYRVQQRKRTDAWTTMWSTASASGRGTAAATARSRRWWRRRRRRRRRFPSRC